jgi:hypothetical protein
LRLHHQRDHILILASRTIRNINKKLVS